jgi:hypothetical protein
MSEVEKKVLEIKEKYADIINDLATKYEKDVGVGFDMLIAIARAKDNNEEPEYTTDIEFDMEELKKDYDEYLILSEAKKTL